MESTPIYKKEAKDPSFNDFIQKEKSDTILLPLNNDCDLPCLISVDLSRFEANFPRFNTTEAFRWPLDIEEGQ